MKGDAEQATPADDATRHAPLLRPFLTSKPIDGRLLEMTKADEKPPALEDSRGLKCPLPALKTRRALARLEGGATLIVLADDPMAAIDIPHLVRELGDELVEASQQAAALRFVIRKRAGGGRS